MACFLTITTPEDMPLDEAIFEPVSGKIFGVRSQWIYRFDAATAAKEAEFRFYDRALGRSCITTLAGSLYCAPNSFEQLQYNNLRASPDRDVFVVDGNLSASIPLQMYLHLNNTFGSPFQPWQALIPAGGKVQAVDYDDGFWNFTNLIDQVRPSGGYCVFMEYDPVNNMVWGCDPRSPRINLTDGLTFFAGLSNSELAPSVTPYGVAYAANVDAAYFALGTSILTKVSGAVAANCLRVTFTDFPHTEINTGVAGINPNRIRYCPYSPHPFQGKLLIPTWSGDSVLVFDPVGDVVTNIKTGFLAPIDIVFTPSTAFAVQNSPVGLKEILP